MHRAVRCTNIRLGNLKSRPLNHSVRTVATTKQQDQSPTTKQQESAETQDSNDAPKAELADKAETKLLKTTAQRDEDLRQKMMDLSGDGGESGVEYEDGQPVAMKRSVKNNMFRYI